MAATCRRRFASMAHHLRSISVTLSDGNRLPVLGLGTYQPYLYNDVTAESRGETERAVLWGLKHGYRLIDTASCYRNESEVGSAIAKSGVPRDEIAVITKLWDEDHGKEKTLASFQNSLQRLGVDCIDLYLMHSPMGGKTVETWDTMVELKEKGLIRSIGVCSFNVHHLKQLKMARPNSIPAVNQIEVHPYLSRDECVSYCQQESIQIMAYAPLAKGLKLRDTPLVNLAERYGKSTAQVLIRWSIQRGFICIPKSDKESRIVDNGDVFDFQISGEDMKEMNGFNEDLVTDWDPMTTSWEP